MRTRLGTPLIILERRIEEQLKTISDLNDTLLAAKTGHEEADSLSLSRLLSMLEKDSQIKALEQQLKSQKGDIEATVMMMSLQDRENISCMEQTIRSKDEQLRRMEQVKEDTGRDYKNQLEELNASLDQLRGENHSLKARLKTAKEDMERDYKKQLEELKSPHDQLIGENHRLEADMESLRTSSWLDIKLLNEQVANQRSQIIALQDSNLLQEAELCTLRNTDDGDKSTDPETDTEDDQLKTSEEAYEELLAKYTELESECKNLTLLKDEATRSLKEEVKKSHALQEAKQSMSSKHTTLESKCQKIQDAHDKLQSEHTLLLSKSAAYEEEKTADVEALKEEARMAKNNVLKLEQANLSLTNALKTKHEIDMDATAAHEEANKCLKEKLNEQLATSEEAYEELLAKYTALEGECKNITLLRDEATQILQDQAQKAQSSKKELDECRHVHEEQLAESTQFKAQES